MHNTRTFSKKVPVTNQPNPGNANGLAFVMSWLKLKPVIDIKCKGIITSFLPYYSFSPRCNIQSINIISWGRLWIHFIAHISSVSQRESISPHSLLWCLGIMLNFELLFEASHAKHEYKLSSCPISVHWLIDGRKRLFANTACNIWVSIVNCVYIIF